MEKTDDNIYVIIDVTRIKVLKEGFFPAIPSRDNKFPKTSGSLEMASGIARSFFRNCQIRPGNKFSYCQIDLSISVFLRAQRLINLEIPVLVRSLKSSNVELG